MQPQINALAQFLDDPDAFPVPSPRSQSALLSQAEKIQPNDPPFPVVPDTSLEAGTPALGLTAEAVTSATTPPAPQLSARIGANQELARRLEKMGNTKAARALRDCQKMLTLYCCDKCHSAWHAPIHCGHRFCHVCQPKRARRVAYFALQLFARAKEPRWMTLTMLRAPTLAIGLQNLRDAWRSWRAIPGVRKLLHGGFYQIEVKPKADGWHVHIHALIDGHYFPKSVLWATWAKALHQASASVQINRCSGPQIVRYVTKYATKPAEFDAWTDEQIAEYAAATYHRRLTGTWGTWYQKTLEDLLDGWEPRVFACPHCKATGTCYPARAGPRIWGEAWPWYKAYYWPDMPTNIENPDWLDETESELFRNAINEEF